MNVRFFAATKEDAAPAWWFGGGMDLTPYYGFARTRSTSTHLQARTRPVRRRPARNSRLVRPLFSQAQERARGIGGIFFDDLNSRASTRASR
jgi:coproporphyrinogen III oxidase